MARADAVLFCAALALSALGLMFAIDLFFAANAASCSSAGAGPGCYPWGTEGPAAGSWRYASKTHYVLSGIASLVVPLAVVGFLGWMKYRDKPLVSWQRVLLATGLIATATLVAI